MKKGREPENHKQTALMINEVFVFASSCICEILLWHPYIRYKYIKTLKYLLAKLSKQKHFHIEK